MCYIFNGTIVFVV